jgi:hypothetical protein
MSTQNSTLIDTTNFSDATLVAIASLVPPAFEDNEPCLPTLAYRELEQRGLARKIENPLNKLVPPKLNTKFDPIWCHGSFNKVFLEEQLETLVDFYLGDEGIEGRNLFERFVREVLEQ